MSEKEFFAVLWLLALLLVMGFASAIFIHESEHRHNGEMASLRAAVAMYEAMLLREPNE